MTDGHRAGAESGALLASRAMARAVSRVELVAWGEAFGRAARAPLIVALVGELGAGKTTLAQAICAGYGVTEAVTSPTFALVHEYRAPASPVYHLDLYRLRDARDLLSLGWGEIVNARALVLIEWPERAGAELPGEATRIALAHLPGDDGRRMLTVA